MRSLHSLACLLVALAVPMAAADFHVGGDGPFHHPVPYAPQAFCAFYFDQVGTEQECVVEASVVDAGVLTLRTNGLVSVQAIVSDGATVVAGLLCLKPIPHCDVNLDGAPRTGTLRLYVHAWDAIPRGVATAEVAAGVALPP